MDLVHLSIFVLCGAAVGFLAGLFGIGGGALIVPILLFSYERSGVPPAVLTHMAVGTSLFVIFFASLTSAYQHGKQKSIHWRTALILGLSSALTAFAATKLATHLKGQHLRAAFAITIISVAIRMFFERELKDRKRAEAPLRLKAAPVAGIGLSAGIVSSLAGVGGAGVTIPMMYYLLKMPLKLAIGTSSATIVVTALFSVLGYILNGLGRPDLPSWSCGFVDLPRGAALVAGSLFPAKVGAYVSFRTQPFRLRKMYALFLIVISVYILAFR